MRRLYRTHFGKFRNEFSTDDLVQEALKRVVEQWPRYDPTRSAPSTFITQRVTSRIYDILRSANRRIDRDHTACALHPEVQITPAPAIEAYDPNQPLEDWLLRVYQTAKRTYAAPRWRQGRKFYNVAQLVAMAALMRRMKLSSRGCRQLLSVRPDLQRVLRFHLKLPSQTSIVRAMWALSEFQTLHAPPKKRTKRPRAKNVDSENPRRPRSRSPRPPRARKRIATVNEPHHRTGLCQAGSA